MNSLLKGSEMLVFSTGQIAAEIGEDRDAVSYAIRKAGVQPVGRAGLVRLFPQSAVDTVRAFLATKRTNNQPRSATQ
jgi:hypothetical protein